MTRWAASLIDLPPAGTLLLKATLLLALGWMLYAVLLRANPRWRVLLWRGVLVGLLALPVAEAVLPELNVAIQREAVIAVTEPVTEQPLEFLIPNAIPNSALEGELGLPAPPPVQQQVIRLSLLTWGREHLKVLLFSCWALVSAVLFLRLAMTADRVRRAVQNAEPAPERVSRAAARVAKDLGCRAAMDVRVMNNLASPFLIGLWRPVVVVPARMARDDQAEEWPAIFAHELAHHMSRDILWLPLTTIAATLLWFHPLAWRLCAAHRRACEEVSDAVATDYIGDSRAYSQTLARSALAMTAHMQAPGGLPMIRSANIARRLAKIRKGIKATLPPRKQLIAALLVSIVGLAVLGSLRLVRAVNDPPETAIEQDLVFPPAEPGKRLPPIEVDVDSADLTVELPGLNVVLLAIISPEGDVLAPNGKAFDTGRIESHIIERLSEKFLKLKVTTPSDTRFGILLRLRYTQGFEGEKDIYRTRIEHAQFSPSRIGRKVSSWSRETPLDSYELLELNLRDGESIETGFDLITEISYGPPFPEQVKIDPDATDRSYEFELADFVATVYNLPEIDPEERIRSPKFLDVVLRFTRVESLSNFGVWARLKDGRLIESGSGGGGLDNFRPQRLGERTYWGFKQRTPISKASLDTFVFMGHRNQPIRWKGLKLAQADKDSPATASVPVSTGDQNDAATQPDTNDDGLAQVERTKPDEYSGFVFDEEGNPLAGVLVDAWTWHTGNETYTDEEGAFRLTGLNPKRRIQVRFSKENYSPHLIVQQPIGISSALIVLDDDTYFEGRVTGPDGAPVPNVLIRADRGPKSADGVVIGSNWTETYSDDTGVYRLYVEEDSYDIQVKSEDGNVARLESVSITQGKSRPLDIPLRPGVNFQAIIVDSQTGDPIPDVRLWHWQHRGVEGRSDSNGLLQIPGMLPANFEFDVEAAGYTRWWSEACLSEWNRYKIDDAETGWQRNFDDLDFLLYTGMAPVKIMLEKGVQIRGVVVDPDGNPVAGATVAPARTGTGNSITGDTRFSVVTQENGSFEAMLPASKQAEYNLIAHDGKYREWRNWANGVAEPIRTQPGQTINGVEIRLTRPATVRGRVTDPSGKPVPGREVRASALDKRGNRYYDPTTANTDARGRFEIKFIRPGQHYIQVKPFWLNAEEAPSGTSVMVTLSEGDILEGIELVAR